MPRRQPTERRACTGIAGDNQPEQKPTDQGPDQAQDDVADEAVAGTAGRRPTAGTPFS
jgi:hypothetical protein